MNLLLVADLSARAADPEPAAASGWEVEIAPYLWAVALDGRSTSAGDRIEFNVPLSDAFSNGNVGGVGVLNARRGRWVLAIDGLGGSLDADVSGDFVTLDANLVTGLGSVGYRVFSGPRTRLLRLPPEATPRRLDVDVLVGVRFWYLHSKLRILAPGVVPGLLRINIRDTHTGLDANLRLMARTQLSDRLELQASGDLGGFGDGTSWGAVAALGYRLGARWSLQAGYRLLFLSRDEGGTDTRILLKGPVVGLAYRFGGD